VNNFITPPGIYGDTSSVYRDQRVGGGACVLAEYRTRFNLLTVNLAADPVKAVFCESGRFVTLKLPAATCSYLATTAAGYTDGDGYYTGAADGTCELQVRGLAMNPRIRIDGFIPDSVNPKAGDVSIVVDNPHYGQSGVTHSCHTFDLVSSPAAIPAGSNGTNVSYSGTATLHTFVSGRLDRQLDQSIPGFSLNFDVLMVQ